MKGIVALCIAALLLAGCAGAYYGPPPGSITMVDQGVPVAKVCDASGWNCQNVYAPAAAAVYVYPVPVYYYGPTFYSCCYRRDGKWWRW